MEKTPMTTTLRPLPEPGGDATPLQRRWFREPMVWLVISGPLVVVIASIASAIVAWKHIDPVIVDPVQGRVHLADDMAVTKDPKHVLAPAQRARNHASTPDR
jgi:uncharacterized protein